jgi:hypothetical protein
MDGLVAWQFLPEKEDYMLFNTHELDDNNGPVNVLVRILADVLSDICD